MSWQPQEAPIRELAGYLKDSLGYDTTTQQSATQVSCLPCPMSSLLRIGRSPSRTAATEAVAERGNVRRER